MMHRSETNSIAAIETPEKSSSNIVRMLILGAFLLFLIWFGIKAWRIGQAAVSLQNYQTEAEQMMANGVSGLNSNEVESMVLGIRSDVLTIKRETSFLMPLTPYLGWIPKYGGMIEVAPHYLEMADAGTETAAFAVRGLIPALDVMQNDTQDVDPLAAIIQVVHQAEPDLFHAGESLNKVIVARANITNEAEQPVRIQTLLAVADKWLPIAQDGLKAALILPEMMGIDGPRSYLIMAQNEDELRATGGFVTGGGLLVVDNGRIQSLDFQDSYLIDDIWSRGYELPPEGYYDIMGFELFLYRDSNYWPDFPTSAEAAMELYSYGQDYTALDGAIAIDQHFLEILLAGTGPINIPETEQVVDSSNVIKALQDSWSRPENEEDAQAWFAQRKSFLPTFATGFLTKIQSDFGSLDPVTMAESLVKAIETKRLQIYMRDPAVGAVFDELGWDGRLENPMGQDYWMLVDTNLGFNKVNLYVTREMEYHIMLDEQGGGLATLKTIYTHAGNKTVESCVQQVPTYEAPTYLAVADACFWNFLRLYTPKGSQLIDATRYTIPADATFRVESWDQPAYTTPELTDWTTFANFMFIEQNSSHQTEMSYSLPSTIVTTLTDGRQQYHLHIAKQAGTLSYPVKIIITLPQNAELIMSSHDQTVVEDNQIIIDLSLRTDTNVAIQYRE
ncbi:MAG: DUF4012 domain-containing protein [Chloroflexi bacterium]|nr:DUF4012 domain-containing protein [Chloroflexota bacterium]